MVCSELEVLEHTREEADEDLGEYRVPLFVGREDWLCLLGVAGFAVACAFVWRAGWAR